MQDVEDMGGVVEDGLEKVKFVNYFLWYLRIVNSVKERPGFSDKIAYYIEKPFT